MINFRNLFPRRFIRTRLALALLLSLTCLAISILNPTSISQTTLLSLSSSSRHKRSLFQQSAATSWYGINAYRHVTGASESWSWIITFIESIPHVITNATRSLNLPQTVRSIRFEAVTTTGFEEQFLKDHLQMQPSSTILTLVPRYDCGYPKCLVLKRKLILRDVVAETLDEDVVVMHGLVTDIYDLKRMLAAVSGRTKILVLAVTTYSSRTKNKEENYGLQLYDFLQCIYFQLDWIPTYSLQYGCNDFKQRTGQGCQLWIAWTKWESSQTLQYFPPAGDGSPEMDLQRYSSVVHRPQSDACLLSQKIGGIRRGLTFIDGQYTVCLDQLRVDMEDNTCLVYSFGISHDWTFDEEMLEAGCEVHSFDPSIGLTSHKRADRHWFYDWGLTSDVYADPKWDVASYSDIRRRLGHTGRPVTLVKMDVEGAEWMFLRDAVKDPTILDTMDQLVVEIHPQSKHGTWRDVIRERAFLLYQFQKRGFVLFSSRQNVLHRDIRSIDY